MFRFSFCCSVLCAVSLASVLAHPNHQLDLTYTTPGKDWSSDALPLGNGYFGALVLGGVEEDRLRITDPALGTADNPPAPLADLVIRTGHDPARARTFLRRLDLQTASVEISYRDGRERHRREYFASYPDRVLVGRLRAVQKQGLDLTLSWAGNDADNRIAYVPETRRYALSGLRANGDQRFGAELEVRLKDDVGEVTLTGDDLHIGKANEVILLLTLDQGDSFSSQAHLDDLKHDDAITLHRRHLSDYQELFHAMYLTLEGGAKTQLATAKRRLLYQEKPEEDPGFEELLFQYGRYLLLASSREGGPFPARPSGIWSSAETPEAAFPPANRETLGLIYSGAGPSQLGVCLPPLAALWDRPARELYFYQPDLTPWLGRPSEPLGKVAHLIENAQQGQGDPAYEHLRSLLQTSLTDNLFVTGQNLAANMALVRGMTDLFASEKNGVLHWVDSLPRAWPDGSVVGLRTPRYEVAYVWQGGAFLEGYLTPLQAGEVRIQSSAPLLLDRPGAETATLVRPDERGLLSFQAAGEETVRLRREDGR